MSSHFKSKSFGIVVYQDKMHYDDNDLSRNMNLHIPASKKDIVLGLFKKFFELKLFGNNIIEEIVIGHEHGKENYKCHMQMYVKFSDQVRRVINPGTFVDDGITYLYITQHAKSPKKLKEYCKKDKDFIELYPSRSIVDFLKDEKVLDNIVCIDDPYNELLNNDSLNEADIKNMFASCLITEYKKDFMSNSKKILDTYNKFIKDNGSKLEFKWTFPKHMLNYIETSVNRSDDRFKAYSKILSWFITYCNISQDKIIRRKALFLFSAVGGVGKTYFARSLVPEEGTGVSPFYVYCRGTLDGAEFLRKNKTAKLVILDDINYINNDVEIWKALAVSEPTNVRSPYHNIYWDKSLPCILMSNNIKTLNYWLEKDDLRGRCIFVGVDFFIGPPEFDNPEYQSIEKCLTNDIEIRLSELNNHNQ